MDNQLFRKAALDKLASPERLDVLMQVTSPKGWLALWTVGGILISVIVWSIVGSIPRKAEGKGILLRGGGLQEIRAEGEGTLTAFNVVPGQEITEGQKVGEIARVQVNEQVGGAQDDVDRAKQDAMETAAQNQATIANMRGQIARFESDIQRTEAQIAMKEADAADKRELLKKGLVTKQRVDQLESELLGLRNSVSGFRAQITSSMNQIRATEGITIAKQQGVIVAQKKVIRTENVAAAVTEVRSTVRGRVVEVKKRSGDRIQTGEALIVVEPPSSGLDPIVYVDSALGKLIKPGMEAQVSPSNVKREEHGYMKATIRSVGDYAVTLQAVQAKVANQLQAQELVGETSKIEITAMLIPNANTPSGYQWSSSVGPPFKLSGGTPINVLVIYERKRPISLVLPIIRGALGS